MRDIQKCQASHAEADPHRRDASTVSEVACGVVHGDVEAAASDRVHQIEQIDDEFRRALEPGVIEHLPVRDLKPNPHNARKHPESQIELLAASIRQFGFVGAIVVDEGNVIIAGHGRYEAAKRNGMDIVPCIRSRI
jgi:ParB/Sulfiredoxin domain